MSPAGAALVTALVVLGMVVVLPLGLRLLGPALVPAPTSPVWPLTGAAGAVSLLLARGPVAVVLACVFAASTLVLAAAGARHAWVTFAPVRRPCPDAEARARRTAVGPAVAVVAALATPAVGAAALVAERGGWGLLGFSGTYLALTVPHMLYAGFGAALVAGSVAQLAPDDRWAQAGAWAVPVGTVLVLLGYFVGDVAELVGALVLTVALWSTAFAVARSLAVRRGRPAGPTLEGDGRPSRSPGTPAAPATARWFLGAGVAVVVVSMLLAVWWAVGEAFAVAHPSLDVMAATHGVANAVGFVLCTVTGLRMLTGERAREATADRRARSVVRRRNA